MTKQRTVPAEDYMKRKIPRQIVELLQANEKMKISEIAGYVYETEKPSPAQKRYISTYLNTLMDKKIVKFEERPAGGIETKYWYLV